MTDTTPSWAKDLAHKLLKEAPENLPFWQIMANGIADERSRCAGLVRACVPSYHDAARRLEQLAVDVEEGQDTPSWFESKDHGE